jgi:hypothetical protein
MLAAAVFAGLGIYHVTLPAGVLLLGAAVAFVVLALYGERIIEVSAGGVAMKLVAKEVADVAKKEAAGRAERVVHELSATLTGEGGLTGNITLAPEPAVLRTEAREPTVQVASFTAEAVLAAGAIEEATTPEELRERAAEFLRSLDRIDSAAIRAYVSRLTPQERAAMFGRKDEDAPTG